MIDFSIKNLTFAFAKVENVSIHHRILSCLSFNLDKHLRVLETQPGYEERTAEKKTGVKEPQGAT